MSTQDQWHNWNDHGFIPGEEETEEAFLKRISYCKNLDEHLTKSRDTLFPFETQNGESKVALEEAFSLTQDLYGIRPEWVPLFFSNYHLAPWHGGCAWIFQMDADSPTAAFLQLRSHFRSASSFLSFFKRKELVAHEISHVGRMVYHEPQFEEIFAYQSSSSLWRRWLSPIVQSAKESLIFILVVTLVILIDFAFLTIETPIPYPIWWFFLLPLALILFGLIRLMHRHHTLKNCIRNLESLYSPKIARHLCYRLRDEEIKLFSCLSPSEIQNEMKRKSKNSFRWKFLESIYKAS